jgi:hypothetical protein
VGPENLKGEGHLQDLGVVGGGGVIILRLI